MTTPGLGASD